MEDYIHSNMLHINIYIHTSTAHELIKIKTLLYEKQIRLTFSRDYFVPVVYHICFVNLIN